jgi:uncharacterized protein YndB with AHSA1/START domain
MTQQNAPSGIAPIQFERRYDNAAIEDLWELWTTKEGFETWWGPQGFRVAVQELDARVGGELLYDMIAEAPEQVEYMKSAGMSASHETRGRFTQITRLRSLQIVHAIDFIPGVKPYENQIRAEFFAEKSGGARMLVTVEPHPDPAWTRSASLGMQSQLTKIANALAERRARLS